MIKNSWSIDKVFLYIKKDIATETVIKICSILFGINKCQQNAWESARKTGWERVLVLWKYCDESSIQGKPSINQYFDENQESGDKISNLQNCC